MSADDHRHLRMEAKYNHAVSIAFTVENDRPDGELTKDEIIHGLMRRMIMLMENPDEFSECCETYDTVEKQET